MELFFLETFTPGQPEVVLSPEESHHLTRVLRRRVGDALELTDGNGRRLQGEIVFQGKKEVRIRIRQEEQVPFPATNELEIGVGIIRPNRMDWLVEKLTELGVRRIVPLICKYSNFKKIKAEHLRKISISAIKQSRQFYLPEIAPPQPCREWMENLPAANGNRFLAHPDGKATRMKRWESPELPLILVVGPEGGFHPEELALAREQDFQLIRLNTPILRTETAAVVATALLKNFL